MISLLTKGTAEEVRHREDQDRAPGFLEFTGGQTRQQNNYNPRNKYQTTPESTARRSSGKSLNCEKTGPFISSERDLAGSEGLTALWFQISPSSRPGTRHRGAPGFKRSGSHLTLGTAPLRTPGVWSAAPPHPAAPSLPLPGASSVAALKPSGEIWAPAGVGTPRPPPTSPAALRPATAAWGLLRPHWLPTEPPPPHPEQLLLPTFRPPRQARFGTPTTSQSHTSDGSRRQRTA